MTMRVGRHRILGEIASGGMATVHLACLVGPGAFASVTALKRLHPHLAKQPGFRAMLLDEARLSARVIHPNVVRTLDVLEQGDDVVIVMEYAAGLPLIKVVQLALEQGASIPVDVAVGITVGMLHGLHAAHEATAVDRTPLGIVHRDVSPQNVIVGADGVPRLIDFGIAKARNRLTTTEDGIAKGKQGYMAPEQLVGEPLGRETDVFGAGVVLWELLAEERLFSPDEPRSALATRVAGDVAIRPSERRPDGARDIPPALDAIVATSLRRRKDDRFPTADALARALSSVVAPASPARIAEWLDGIAGAELAAQRDVVANAIAFSTCDERDETRADSSDGLTPVSSTSTVVLPVPARTQGRRHIATVAAIAVVAVTLALAGSAGIRRARGAATSPPPVEAPSAPVVEAPAAAIAPPPTPAPAATPEPAATSSVKRRVTARPMKSRCSPPYTFDDEGHKIYKPECF